MREKKEIIIKDLLVESVAAEGKCVARRDGQVIFITETAPGDIVDVRITRKKKSFLESIPIHYHTKSNQRVEPFCAHFDMCGGCKWQHLNYTAQINYKQQQVQDQLERIGKLDLPEILPIIPSKKTTHYRNKLEYTFTPKRWLTKEEISSGEELDRRGAGFHAPGRFDKVIDIENCHLQPEPSNELRLFVKYFTINNGFSFYNVAKFEGLMRNLIVRTASTGEIMTTIQFAENDPERIELLCAETAKVFPEITSLNYVVNTKKNDKFHDLDVVNYSGTPYIMEEMEDVKFRIGPKSFFQTNTDQALRLYQEARKLAALSGNEIVYDLYTGTGSIANFIAGSAKIVIGIESIPEAIEDAKVNSEINGISNTNFIAGDARELLNQEFFETHGSPEVIITDPPRAGMHEDVVRAIIAASPKRIVYISCNPATQARDLEWMADDYKVETVQPIDMFPHTHHVENIVLIVKK